MMKLVDLVAKAKFSSMDVRFDNKIKLGSILYEKSSHSCKAVATLHSQEHLECPKHRELLAIALANHRANQLTDYENSVSSLYYRSDVFTSTPKLILQNAAGLMATPEDFAEAYRAGTTDWQPLCSRFGFTSEMLKHRLSCGDVDGTLHSVSRRKKSSS